MKVFEVKAESKPSKILIGERLSNLPKYLEGRNVIILTDSNILKYYNNDLPTGIPIIEMGLGEKNKTISTIEMIMGELLKLEADRTSFLLAIGGGIVCDVGGCAASVYMRGIPFGFVSTTLLSQVDASVGGKNGVNYEGFKNMVGVFNQPEFVLCDNRMFSTLEKDEFRSGFAEIIKAGAIKNVSLFRYCKEHRRFHGSDYRLSSFNVPVKDDAIKWGMDDRFAKIVLVGLQRCFRLKDLGFFAAVICLGGIVSCFGCIQFFVRRVIS